MEPISIYTRQQAIDDGVLIDVSDTSEAREAGFKIPIAITASVRALCLIPEGLGGIQDYKGRLWDTLWLASNAFRSWKINPDGNDGRILPYRVIYLMRAEGPEMIDLWLVFNEYEGFTIMKPEEY